MQVAATLRRAASLLQDTRSRGRRAAARERLSEAARDADEHALSPGPARRSRLRPDPDARTRRARELRRLQHSRSPHSAYNN